jgi:hypothetical protein
VSRRGTVDDRDEHHVTEGDVCEGRRRVPR